MKAAPEAQVKLLEIQELDKKIAGLRHQLKTLPAAARLAEIAKELQGLHEKLTLASAGVKDAQRAVKGAEAEVEKVQERARTQRERLDSGTLSPKEMERIQEELGLLAARQGELEDRALEAMDAVEAATQHQSDLNESQAALQAEQAELEASMGAEASNLQGDLDRELAARADLTQGMPAELLEEYDACRRATGGLGVVEVHGVRPVGRYLEFSTAEVSRLETAASDDVIVSEDHEVILVRTQ